jgi:shikimate kinase/3-dehydroquinate synthase
MRIFLSGLMGSGKSTVARALGSSSGLPVFDIDEVIESEAGQSVSSLFASRGEEAFRAIEAKVITSLIGQKARGVFSLGGGAVTQRALRRSLLGAGLVVTLDAPTQTLATRVGSGEGRPLLQGRDVPARLDALRSARAEAYAECHVRLETTHAAPAELAKTLLDAARAQPIAVPLGLRTYCVYVGAGQRHELGARVRAEAPVSSVMLVSDAEVGPRWARALAAEIRSAGLSVSELEIGAGESAKTLATVDSIWNAALDAGLDRSSLVIGVGGGVVGDLSGFAAATLLRGVRAAHVPTTLLAMVDSAIGGKTGFDVRQGKNLVGAFHQPRFVLSDVEVLATLPDEELRAGLAEVVKTAWIAGESEVAELERDAPALLQREPAATERAIRMAVRVKARVVTEDEREDGLRAVLNLGHTLAHAIEAANGYSGLRHGEAVALGCVAAFRIAAGLGGATASADGRRMRGLLERLGLPVAFEQHLTDRVLSFLGSDKKRKGKSLHYVVPGQPGDVRVVPLPVDEIVRLLRSA